MPITFLLELADRPSLPSALAKVTRSGSITVLQHEPLLACLRAAQLSSSLPHDHLLRSLHSAFALHILSIYCCCCYQRLRRSRLLHAPQHKDQGSQTSLHRSSITSPPNQTTTAPSQCRPRRPPWRTSSVASTTGCCAYSGTPTCLLLPPQKRRPGCLMRPLILSCVLFSSAKKQSRGRR
jgi:hypothetical protein